MAVTARHTNPETSKIALVNLVETVAESAESGNYKYIATRVYDAETDTVADVVLPSKGRIADMTDAELHYAVWQELPKLDIKTKQLVGKNKDKYCTLIAVRVCCLSDCGQRGTTDAMACSLHLPTGNGLGYDVWALVHILGYTFMDINGDKVYLTLAQFRKSYIIQHAHSTGAYVSGRLCGRRVSKKWALRYADIPTLTVEIDDTDTSIKDEEIEQVKLLKPLVDGWYTLEVDGTIRVDRGAISRQQLEEVEIPEGVLYIPDCAFYQLRTIKRVKLSETVLTIASRAFGHLTNLEEINVPNQVKALDAPFRGCRSLKCLDLSGVERLSFFDTVTVKRLILPDAMQENDTPGSITIGVLEFRPRTNVKPRVLGVSTGGTAIGRCVKWQTERIETNGPVVLGNYRVDINCTDTSVLEPNIIGIAPNSSFHKVDAEGNPLPWLFGPTTEFVYVVGKGGYRFTEEAYKANKLRAAVVDITFDVILPKSVEIMQGILSESMCKEEYPNVVYASLGLCFTCGLLSKPPKLPLLRWLLPKGEILTERQIKDLEGELTPKLPEICERIQKACAWDLTTVEGIASFKWMLLQSLWTRSEIVALFKEYGMVYVGDYSKFLRRKQQ